jgi:hypothetical protein
MTSFLAMRACPSATEESTKLSRVLAQVKRVEVSWTDYVHRCCEVAMIRRIVAAFRWLGVWRLPWRSRRNGVSLNPSPIVLVPFLLLSSLAQTQTTGALFITSPANGTRVDGRLVRVQFELTPGISANGIPEFRVQLDRQSPALISDTEYILYWLSPGWHTVTVSLVDANGTPIFGARNQVQFEVSGDRELPH